MWKCPVINISGYWADVFYCPLTPWGWGVGHYFKSTIWAVDVHTLLATSISPVPQIYKCGLRSSKPSPHQQNHSSNTIFVNIFFFITFLMRVVSDPLNGQWQSSLYFRNTAEWDNPSSLEFLVGCESSWEMWLTRNEMEQLEVCSNLFSQDLWEILGPAIHRALLDILPDKSQVNLSFLLFKDKMIRVSSLGQREITKKINQRKQIKANKKSQWANSKTPWWGFCWPQRES